MPSTEDHIALALTRLFERHRIVFWYDAKHELRDTFEKLRLPDVEKVTFSKNVFALKYRLLRGEPKQKFLLYHEGPRPPDSENWLLDVQLAHGTLQAELAVLWLAELELGPEFADIVQAHAEFFQATKRKDDLKRLLKTTDTAGQIRTKMLAVCAASEPRLDTVLEHLLQERADDRDEKIRLIERCRLDTFLWEQMNRGYGYASREPSVQDFAIELFKSCYAMGTNAETESEDKAVKLTGDALVFLKSWKDSRSFEDGFKRLSKAYAEVLGIEQDLAERDFRELLELDYFELIDQKILSDMVRAVAARTAASDAVAGWVRQRRSSHWYADYEHPYEAVYYAAQFLHALGEARLEMDSLAEGVQRYSGSWYRLDQLYRKFVYHTRKAGHASLMSDLSEQIENLYTTTYLVKLGDLFQAFVDAAPEWRASPVLRQNEFFKHWVELFLRKENKVCVIISDAMRYEVGEELMKLIRQEDRYKAELEPMLSMLPSYTQLGMAALLPHKTLAIAENDSSTVLVDGNSSRGTANRDKILTLARPQRATARQANELMTMKNDACRELVRDHDLIYVYHNRIDATGDKRDTEGQVFEAVENTLQELLRLIKKLAGANARNLLVTSDHGFIYQNRPIGESDFAEGEAEGEQILFRDRRYVLGKGLAEASSLHTFTPEQLGLAGEVEVQIPKSINRLRLQGSGSRFVHGGATLQEVVIPVLQIHKSRQSDVTTVEVNILRGDNSMITSGQLAVTLYQTQPVTEKNQPRVLRAGIYTKTGELISDTHKLTFDMRSNNPRERETKVRFVLTRKADEANGQEVLLRLDEQHTGTSHHREYKRLGYLMRRAFTSDFEL